jgi:hypothetical protein
MKMTGWIRIIFLLAALGFMQLVITQLSQQNGGIISMVKKGIS